MMLPVRCKFPARSSDIMLNLNQSMYRCCNLCKHYLKWHLLVVSRYQVNNYCMTRSHSNSMSRLDMKCSLVGHQMRIAQLSSYHIAKLLYLRIYLLDNLGKPLRYLH